MTKINNEEGESKIVIGEATPVRIGLVIVLLATLTSSVWWASSINSKLDAIISFQNNTITTFSELKAKDIALDKEISDLNVKMAILEVSFKGFQDKISNPSQIPSSK